MANPGYTYTFSNGTTSDATQVNQNFTDIINGLTDGTKSLTIAAISASGTATFTGDVNLGDGTPDTISILGSLGTSIPVKTTFSYDIGIATIGWKSIYFGSADSAARTTRIIGATVGSSWTLTLPTGAGTSAYGLRTNGSGVTSWAFGDIRNIGNLGLSCSVGSSALTISLKGADGNDPSATNPVDISFRSATATTGTPGYASAVAATSVVVPSSATLGHISATNQYIWVYAINQSGTVELAVSGIKVFDDGSIQSSTSISAGSTSGTVMYSTTGRSNVGVRLIGRLLVSEATAGTWASAPAEVFVGPSPIVNIEEWSTSRSFTPNNFGTVSAVTYQTKRIGDMLHVKAFFTSGTTVASTASLSLPSGLSADTGKLSSTGEHLGNSIQMATGVISTGDETRIFYDGSDAAKVYFAASVSGTAYAKLNANSVLQNTTPGQTFFSIPIAGWSLYGP